MSTIRFLHCADVHFDAANQVPALASLRALDEAASRFRPAFMIIAGDLFNRAVPDTEAAGFPKLLEVLRSIRAICPILAVYGTPTHDLPGAYAPLEAAGLVRMVYSASTIFLDDPPDPKLLILGCPEPSKEWFLAGASGISADEAAERVKEGMRRILLGLGAVRAEHPDLPCVFIYHGQIAGASMANGQLANGGLALGREDLALVGADFYALGDIHLAQQIPGLPAYYPGSAYPVNWGETDQKGFNLVTLPDEWPPDQQRAEVERIPFPHPPREKFTTTWPEPLTEEQCTGKQVWQVYRATKEDARYIDAGNYADALMTLGALPGSRVTVELIPTETVRAAEITDCRTLADKLDVYEQASGQIVTLAETVAMKARELERDAQASGAAPEGAHLRLRKLRLRGAIGVWKGQGVDEITLDFDQYDAGLIALVERNGGGKTTLIENCHPYPCMLTRDGPLQQHFRLRDSARELWFVDERTGAEYRALINIDGANASGSCEYHLFRDGEPLANGRKALYEELIERLFGSLSLYLRSAFVSQRATKSNPDLAEATKGDKKAIFRELAGLSYLQTYADAAKAKGAAIEAELATARGQMQFIEAHVAALPGVRAEHDSLAADLADRLRSLQDLERNGLELKAAADQASAAAEAQRATRARIRDLEDRANQKRTVISLGEPQIEKYREAVERAPAAQAVVDQFTALKEEEGRENERIAETSKQREALVAQHGRDQAAHADACRKLEAEKAALRTKSASAAGRRNVLRAQIDHLTGELGVPLDENCPTCGQILPDDKRADLKAKRAAAESRLSDHTTTLDEVEEEMAGLDEKVAAITIPPAPAAPTLPTVDQGPLQRIRAQLAALKVEEARRIVATAQEAAVRLDETRQAVRRALDELAPIEAEIEKAALTLNSEAEIRLAEATEALEDARTEYQTALQQKAAIEAKLQAAVTRIAELNREAEDLDVRRAAAEAQERDLADWQYLATACGPDGIQALELDAMGPGIAEVANRLLSAAYGSRYQVEIRTTRIAGKGSRTKQVEDFSIWILDGEAGTEQELSTLSGGEAVWIKRALYAAFGLIRDRSTGLRFLTVFADEADGALDPEAKAHYLAMLEQEHAEAGRRHTILISHSEAVQEAVSQRIALSELAKVAA